jgi:hypothetical protein
MCDPRSRRTQRSSSRTAIWWIAGQRDRWRTRGRSSGCRLPEIDTMTDRTGGPAVRKKAIELTASAFLSFVAGSVGAITIHSAFFVAAAAGPVICGLLLKRLRCPRCGNPIYRNEVHLFGVTWEYWGSFNPMPPSRCWKCSLSFREDA